MGATGTPDDVEKMRLPALTPMGGAGDARTFGDASAGRRPSGRGLEAHRLRRRVYQALPLREQPAWRRSVIEENASAGRRPSRAELQTHG